MIARWPATSAVTMEERGELHPLFKGLKDGISEFTFANIYLFRHTHSYRVTTLDEGPVMITGHDSDGDFFMLPFGMPAPGRIKEMMERFAFMKNATEAQALRLESLGFTVTEDRDNFDYLYSREDLVKLSGRKFHKKKNLVNAFLDNYNYTGRPLLEDYKADALKVLDAWRAEARDPGDYEAAREALDMMTELQLCGGIYYVDGLPAAYTLGEETGAGHFVIHFEKGIKGFKGLMQFVNQSFAAILPEKYDFINREQDLGREGLKKAKLSYRPAGFIKKFKVTAG